MKRIGTLSSAAGLIFLGIWMIINKTNPAVGQEVFKLWPIIIVLMGVEILMHFRKKSAEEKVGFNWLIILVIFIFLIVNLYQGIVRRIPRDISIDNLIRTAEDIDMNINIYKVLTSSKVLDLYGDKLIFLTDNGKINVIKSKESSIRIDAKIYVKRNSRLKEYNISESKEPDGYSVNIKDNDIRKVEADIYIPEKYNLKVEVDNLNLKCNDNLPLSNFDIKGDNCNVDINNISNLDLDFDNGNIRAKDIKSLAVKGDNANVNISGKAENIDIRLDNGKVDISNQLGKNVNIDLGQGIVNYDTQDNNLTVAVKLNQGVCRINDEKRINDGMQKVIGSGQNKVNIKMDQGAVTVSHPDQE